jgi:integrase/recombinase XerD
MNTEALIMGFKDYQFALNRSQSRVDWQVTLINKFFAYLIVHDLDLDDVTEKQMYEYWIHVSQLKNMNGIEYSQAAKNDHLTAVRVFYKYLLVSGQTSQDPTAYIEYGKLPKKLPSDILSLNEMVKLLSMPNIKKTEGMRDSAIMELLYSSGLRRDELRGISLNDIHWDTRLVRVMGKGSVERMVPFGKTAAKALKTWIEKGRPKYVKEKSDNAVFLSRVGMRMSGQSILYTVKKYGEMAGLKVTVHMFRHCCATHMLESGCIDVRSVQEMLGHSKLSTTARYLRVTCNRLREVHSKYHPREQVA